MLRQSLYTRLQCNLWVENVKMQWESGKGGCPLVNGPELAVGQGVNSFLKKRKEFIVFLDFVAILIYLVVKSIWP